VISVYIVSYFDECILLLLPLFIEDMAEFLNVFDAFLDFDFFLSPLATTVFDILELYLLEIIFIPLSGIIN